MSRGRRGLAAFNMLVIAEIVQEISRKMEPPFTQNILITYKTVPRPVIGHATNLAAEGLRSKVLSDLQQGSFCRVSLASARGSLGGLAILAA